MNVAIATNAVELEPMADIDARIRRTFNILGKVARGLILGNIPAAIVSGAAGCGKTYLLDKELDAAVESGEVNYQSVKGAMSAIGLYRMLFECSEPGNVLMIDDCDSIFGDIDALNILKAALDTSKTRRVHWNKESRVLEEEGIPRDFEFRGAVVFITNTDFESEIQKDSKMSPHYRALMSRCLYVDLRIHTKREILVRIAQVVFSKEFLRENGVTKPQAQEMMRWLTEHLGMVRVLSIRTVLQLASMVKTDEDWKDMAEVTMLGRRS